MQFIEISEVFNPDFNRKPRNLVPQYVVVSTHQTVEAIFEKLLNGIKIQITGQIVSASAYYSNTYVPKNAFNGWQKQWASVVSKLKWIKIQLPNPV